MAVRTYLRLALDELGMGLDDVRRVRHRQAMALQAPALAAMALEAVRLLAGERPVLAQEAGLVARLFGNVLLGMARLTRDGHALRYMTIVA